MYARWSALLFFAISCFGIGSTLVAQDFNWNNSTGDNDWFNELNWNLGGDGVPSPGADVNINGGVGTAIYTGGIGGLGALDLGPGAQVDIQLGGFVFGTTGPTIPFQFQNSGVLNIFSTASLQLRDEAHNFSPATINLIDGGILDVHADGALLNTSNLSSGNGTINMSSFTPGAGDSVITGSIGALLSIGKQTITGFGDIGDNRIGLTLDDDTIIDADFNGEEMTIDVHNASGLSNQGTMLASNGGILHFAGPALINNTGGLIEAASGSEVILDSGFDIAGGTLRRVDSGVFSISGNGSLNDIFLDDTTITVPNGRALNLAGAIINQGLITTNSTSTISDIRIDEAATLTGGGTVRLGGTGTQNRVLDLLTSVTGVLTNVDNRIEGQGSLGANLINIINEANGVVDANDTAGLGLMNLDPRGNVPMINRGRFTASNGGTLKLSGGTFDNTGGTIEPQDDSFVEIEATIQGGTLRNVGTGDFLASSGTIEDVTVEGVLNIQNGSALNLNGNINNLGEISTNSTSTVSDIRVDTAASLTGGGTVTLGGTGTQNRILDLLTSTTGVLTNVDNTIQGRGAIGVNLMQLINERDGTIHANVAGTLTIDPPNSVPVFVNEGTLKASNGGTLNVIGALENGIDGVLVGTSTITSTTPILNLGSIAPGNSAGTLTIGNDLELGTTSSLEIEIEDNATFDVLNIDGGVTLDGDLNLTFPNGYVPSPSDSFDILTATSLNGSFSNAADGSTLELADKSGAFLVSYTGGTVRLSNFIEYTVGESLMITRGNLAGGSITELERSENVDLAIQKSPSDFTPRTEFEIESTSPLPNPANMTVVLEGSVFARSQISQRIELFNFNTDQWQIVDTRNASRFNDSRVTVEVTGSVGRFVENGSRTIRARIRYNGGNPRQLFSSNTDQFVWIIQ